MTDNEDIAFTHSHMLLADGAVAFKCSADERRWPWLGLEPTHPIVVQSINYWASVETGKTRGTFDPAKWSALTYTRWYCDTPGIAPVTHGLADHSQPVDDENKPSFRLTFFDAHGSLVCCLFGSGVVFKTRDFESWRDEAKQTKDTPRAPQAFTYAGATALGVSSDVACFLSPLLGKDKPTAHALITKENGLIPHHPYHGGSGDHVNANHLADVGLQFSHLVRGGPLRCKGGEIAFKHYVELDRQFTVTQTGSDIATGAISMVVHQGTRECTNIKLWTEAV